MPIYLCRWENGDCSFVSAPNKSAAILALDEVADPSGAELFVVPDFMLHLALRDDGKFELESMGEQAMGSFDRAYPTLSEALSNNAPAETIVKAVEAERASVKSKPRKWARSDAGRRIQSHIDAPAELIDELEQEAAKQLLKDFKPRGKPH